MPSVLQRLLLCFNWVVHKERQCSAGVQAYSRPICFFSLPRRGVGQWRTEEEGSFPKIIPAGSPDPLHRVPCPLSSPSGAVGRSPCKASIMRDGPLGERLLPPPQSVPTPPLSRRHSTERGVGVPQITRDAQAASRGDAVGGGEDGTFFSRREFFGTPAARQRVIEHHKRKAKSFYGSRTIGEFGSFVYLVNQIFGASLVAIPYVFKASGYIPCLFSNSFTCIVGAFAALMLMRAMTMIKGNYAFQQRVEYAACVAYFLGMVFFSSESRGHITSSRDASSKKKFVRFRTARLRLRLL